MKNLYRLLLLGTFVFFVTSCEEKDDKLTFEGQAVPHFTEVAGELVVDAQTTSFGVEVGTTTGAAATVNVSIASSSTAIEGVHFETLNKSVAIGANEYVGQLSVVPLFDNIDDVYYLDLEIEGAPENTNLGSVYQLKISRFCNLVVSEWTGAISGTDNGGLSHNGTVAPGTGDQIILEADASGNPTFLQSLFAGWGETFQPSFGNEGDLIINLNEDGTLEIPDQYMGQTLPGPWDYWVNGSGRYDQCTRTLILDYNVYDVDGYADPWFSYRAVLTMD